MEAEKLVWVDANGKRWSTAIRFQDAVRLRDLGTDLLVPATMEQIFGKNPLDRIEVLGELARPQWEQAGLAYVDFAGLVLGGETTLADATAALKAALSDFFRRLDRNDLAVVLDRAWDAMVKGLRLAVEKAEGTKVGEILAMSVAKMSRDIDEGLDRAMEKLTAIHGNTSGD